MAQVRKIPRSPTREKPPRRETYDYDPVPCHLEEARRLYAWRERATRIYPGADFHPKFQELVLEVWSSGMIGEFSEIMFFRPNICIDGAGRVYNLTSEDFEAFEALARTAITEAKSYGPLGNFRGSCPSHTCLRIVDETYRLESEKSPKFASAAFQNFSPCPLKYLAPHTTPKDNPISNTTGKGDNSNSKTDLDGQNKNRSGGNDVITSCDAGSNPSEATRENDGIDTPSPGLVRRIPHVLAMAAVFTLAGRERGNDDSVPPDAPFRINNLKNEWRDLAWKKQQQESQLGFRILRILSSLSWGGSQEQRKSLQRIWQNHLQIGTSLKGWSGIWEDTSSPRRAKGYLSMDEK